MQVKGIVAPELIRPVSDPVQLLQELAHMGGVDTTVKAEDINEYTFALIPGILSIKQEQSLIYALADTYANRVWGDLLPEIEREFEGIGKMLRGMRKGNLPHKIVKKSVAEIVQERNIENEELALGVQRIFEAWQVRYTVVHEQKPLSLWPPLFPDQDFKQSPHFFTPILRCVRKRFWKLGDEKDTWPDSPQIFKDRDWESALSKVFNTYRSWYRADQDWWFHRYFTLNPLKRQIYDEIWSETLMTQGELKFGRVQILITPPSPTIKITLDDQTFNVDGLGTYPPDVVRAVIDYSGEHPPIPVNPVESYLKMLGSGQGVGRLTQEGSVYRVTLPKRSFPYFQDYSTKIEARWMDDTHATVSGNRSSLQAQLVVDGQITFLVEEETRGWVTLPDQEMTNEETRRLISVWGMWLWDMVSVDESLLKKHPELQRM